MRAQGRLGLLARVLVMQAWSSIQLGSWNHIEAIASEAARLARETGQPLWGAGAKAAESAAAGIQGDYERAFKLASEVESEALPSALSNVLCVLQVARGMTSLGRGAHEEAYEQLVRVFDHADPAFHQAERVGALGYLTEAAVRTGHKNKAAELVAECRRLAEQTPATVLQLGLLFSEPLVSGEADAEQRFASALNADVAAGPFFRARVQLAFGEWLRRQRRVTESRQVLRLARESFDALRATPWSARAREQLRASGESGSETDFLRVERLTPQEMQIAELAASGMTNREIGQQLFLSHRTVASHLYRLFPKLGITTRSELTSALQRARLSPPDGT
jgi:ATP/maltotriose-dependent transcriptional regulator MalT